jgi:hypothetical protein
LDNLISDQTKSALAPYGVEARAQRITHLLRPAPEKRLAFRFSVRLDSFDAAKVAFQVIHKLYSWFGIEEDKIPYVTLEQQAVNVEKLKNPKSENN